MKIDNFLSCQAKKTVFGFILYIIITIEKFDYSKLSKVTQRLHTYQSTHYIEKSVRYRIKDKIAVEYTMKDLFATI